MRSRIVRDQGAAKLTSAVAPAPIPDNEADRLASLRTFAVLDTPQDPRFDAITRLAARVLDAPVVLLSLVDTERVFFKSTVGCFPSGSSAGRDVAFCSHALMTPQQPLVVEDLSRDPRFAANPLVTGAHHLRFYAGVPLLDGAGHALGTLCVLDVRPRRLPPESLEILTELATTAATTLDLYRQCAALTESNADHRAAIALNPQIPWTADPDGMVIDVGPRILELCGVPAADIMGEGWRAVIHPDDVAAMHARWMLCVRTGQTYEIEHRMLQADGGFGWARTYAAPRRDAAGRIVRWYGLSEDITARQRSQMQIAHLAYHDTLTGLPNAAHFRDTLIRHIARTGRGERFALLSVDLDNFKAVNDTLGHPAGDRLLRCVAERLSACARETDTVARLGGDEFFVVQSLLSENEDAARLAQRILDALRAPLELDGHVLTLGGSVGIVVAPRDGRDPDTLLRNADLALYRAKAAGRRTWRFFEPDMDHKLRLRQALDLDLSAALARKEFWVAYQPQLDLQTGQIDCMEALLRWEHPVRGSVSPDDFIPAAERNGLITPIGAWVLQYACAEAARWPQPIRLAVNLSSVQLQGCDLPDLVARTLRQTGLAPSRLELEITESVLLNEADDNLSVLHALRALGVRVALDDFGTGYSSLNYLQRFPFDKLKIDRAFVSRMTQTEQARAIVRAIVAMSRALNITTTAEGVETPSQLEMLRAEGCDQVQGFLFSRAVRASEIAGLLHRLRLDAPRFGLHVGHSRGASLLLAERG